MSRMRLLGGLAAASLMLIAGAASAQTAQARAQRIDIDNDGRVSKAEFVQARLAPLIAMDADKDGVVTVAERTAARQTRTAATATRRFDRLDADKDEVVSRAEFDAARQRVGTPERPEGARHAARRMGPRHAGQRHHGPRRAPEAMRARADQPVVIAEVRAKIEAAFDRLDTNKDGFLVEAERQAARTALRERMQARHAEFRAGEAHAGPRGEARREARRLRRENVAPASPSSPASE